MINNGSNNNDNDNNDDDDNNDNDNNDDVNNNNSLFSQELHMIFSLQTQQIWNIHHMYK